MSNPFGSTIIESNEQQSIKFERIEYDIGILKDKLPRSLSEATDLKKSLDEFDYILSDIFYEIENERDIPKSKLSELIDAWDSVNYYYGQLGWREWDILKEKINDLEKLIK